MIMEHMSFHLDYIGSEDSHYYAQMTSSFGGKHLYASTFINLDELPETKEEFEKLVGYLWVAMERGKKRQDDNEPT